jgi:hypothetical protein
MTSSAEFQTPRPQCAPLTPAEQAGLDARASGTVAEVEAQDLTGASVVLSVTGDLYPDAGASVRTLNLDDLSLGWVWLTVRDGSEYGKTYRLTATELVTVVSYS